MRKNNTEMRIFMYRKKERIRGYLIYYPQEAVRNRGFIQMFQEKGAAIGIDFEYVSVYEYREWRDGRLPDLVLNRTRLPQVSRWYQQKKIPVFHIDSLVELSNDKFKSLEYFKKHLPERVLQEKWCPDSKLLGKEEMEKIYLGQRKLPEDMVIKSLDGHGGTEVFLTEKAKEALSILRGRDALLQERILSDSQDLRAYILGGDIYQTVLRTGKGDFRSNFSLGGSVRSFGLNQEQTDWIQQFIEALPQKWLGMLGMDFIVDRDGRLVFNEIEEMAGCRMLYQCTNCDIVKDYVVRLKTFVENTDCISNKI